MNKTFNSTGEGQKAMFYRASVVNVLHMMNEKIRELDPSEAWHPDNINGASDVEIERLRVSISECLVSLQRAKL